MKEHIEHSYNPETGLSSFTIYYKNIPIIATAQCSPEDRQANLQSNVLGLIIAEKRAWRKYYAYVRDNSIKPQLEALHQLYYSMKHSKQFNSKSYEAKMLFRQIKYHEEDLEFIKSEIKSLKAEENFLIHSLNKRSRSE